MAVHDPSDIKEILEGFYREFDFRERLLHDPIEFPHRYSDPADIEIAGFIAASFAYGKVGLFKPVIEKILGACGKHPSEFIMNFSLSRDAAHLKGISYRFNKTEDIQCLVYILSCVLREWGTLRGLFSYFHEHGQRDIRSGLTGFIEYLGGIDTSAIYGTDLRPRGLAQMLPSPRNGSACKRMNLFLRWMVRDRDIDLGIWDDISPDTLIIPLDTHIVKISRCLGLTRRKSVDWKTAGEITSALKEFDAEDPLKYDFALCHHGISGLCKGEMDRDTCRECVFFQVGL